MELGVLRKREKMKFGSPFFMTKVECPVCGQTNEFENIKAGAYTETERDTDFCPKDIIWANSEYQKINPLLYFMATCPNCFYTHEFNQSLKEWKRDRFFAAHRLSAARERHKQELKQKESMINRLGEALDPGGHPFESAVIKLLLGIYDEKIMEESNALDMGRHYLRIAWLYRENLEEENPAHKVDKLNLTSLEKTLRALRSNFKNHEEKISDLLTSVDACFGTPIGVEKIDQKKEQLKIKSLKVLDKIKEDFSSLQERLEELTDICAESKNFSFGSESGNIKITSKVPESLIPGESLYVRKNHLTFVSFLSSLKEIWPEIPLNELEAMRLALKYYKQSYQEVRDITQENQKIQAAYLIAELSRRVGDFQEAESYFEEAKRSGQDFIQRNQDDANKIALARKIVELAKKQGELNFVQPESKVY
ncbi:MAG: DUF2225 domain-containing protein [candidate division Zixibacteria bacterium]|nr:DUF2225 domain-containing protein [candidate division Zixibacteria bacterium]